MTKALAPIEADGRAIMLPALTSGVLHRRAVTPRLQTEVGFSLPRRSVLSDPDHDLACRLAVAQ